MERQPLEVEDILELLEFILSLHDVFHIQRPSLQTEVWYNYGKSCFSFGGQYVLRRETPVNSTVTIEVKTMEKICG